MFYNIKNLFIRFYSPKVQLYKQFSIKLPLMRSTLDRITDKLDTVKLMK